jgi:hypothetical protein
MKSCHYHPEELLTNKHQQMFHSVWIAGSIAVVGVGTAVASGVASSNAAKSAAKSQDKLAKQQAALAEKQSVSNRQKEMEGYLPGAEAQRGKISEIVNSMLGGEIPQDVRDETMRTYAEIAGAGYNPFTANKTGGFQIAQGGLARNLGLTSFDIQQQGMGIAADWQAQAANFTNQVASDRLQQYGQSFQTRNNAIESRYAADMANVGMIQGVGSALTSGVTTGYAINQQNKANARQDTYLSALSSAYGTKK